MAIQFSAIRSTVSLGVTGLVPSSSANSSSHTAWKAPSEYCRVPPVNVDFSRTMTEAPSSRARYAAFRPAPPAPQTTTSALSDHSGSPEAAAASSAWATAAE